MAEPTAASLVTASLLAGAVAAVPGASVDVGVRLEVADGWHVYWENPGESGMSTSAELEAPGATFGALRFPAPHRFEMAGGIQTYGHGGAPVFLRAMHVAADAAGPLQITGSARYLVCQADRCLYGEQPLSLTLPLAPADDGATGADPLAAARAALPVPPPDGAVAVHHTDAGLAVQLPGLSDADAFPERALDDALAELAVAPSPHGTLLRLTPDDGGPLPADGGLVVTGTRDGQPVAWRLAPTHLAPPESR